MGLNAQTAVPVFTAGQVLTASQQTQINTGIPVFATTVTRDAAFGGTGEKTLAQGQYAYIEATSALQVYSGTAWLAVGTKINQVVSTAKTNTFTTTSTSFTAVTGLSVAITPTATTSKILIFASCNFSTSGSSGDAVSLRLSGGNSATYIGDANGANRVRAALYSNNRVDWGATHSIIPGNIMYLDSPASTSAITYQVEARVNVGGTFVLNKAGTDSDTATFSVTPSSITGIEVLA